MSRTVFCRKYQEELEGLDFPPMPGKKGQELYDTVSKKPGKNGSNNKPC